MYFEHWLMSGTVPHQEILFSQTYPQDKNGSESSKGRPDRLSDILMLFVCTLQS